MIRTQPVASNMARYNRKETIGLLGISMATLDRFEAQGLIEPGIKWGREKLYTGAAIKRCWRNYQMQYSKP